MVHVLIERGYLVREGADGLTLTSKLFEIGLKTPRTRDLVDGGDADDPAAGAARCASRCT